MDLAFRDLIGSNGSRVCKVYDSERAPGADGQRTVTVALQAPVVARVANLKNRTDLLQYGRNAHDHDANPVASMQEASHPAAYQERADSASAIRIGIEAAALRPAPSRLPVPRPPRRKRSHLYTSAQHGERFLDGGPALYMLDCWKHAHQLDAARRDAPPARQARDADVCARIAAHRIWRGAPSRLSLDAL